MKTYADPNGITWQQPEFKDSITDKTIAPECNLYPGDELAIGDHNISCRASHPSVDDVYTVCKFVLTVTGWY